MRKLALVLALAFVLFGCSRNDDKGVIRTGEYLRITSPYTKSEVLRIIRAGAYKVNGAHGVSNEPVVNNGSLTLSVPDIFDQTTVGNLIAYNPLHRRGNNVHHQVYKRTATELYVKGLNNRNADGTIVTKDNYISTTIAILYTNEL